MNINFEKTEIYLGSAISKNTETKKEYNLLYIPIQANNPAQRHDHYINNPNLLIGNLVLKWSNIAFASPRFPSAFSKSMGLTLCGITDEPVSPCDTFNLK